MSSYRRLVTNIAVAAASMGSAVVAAAWCHEHPFGLRITAAWLAIGSLFVFAWATLGRLGFQEETWKGNSRPERLDRAFFHALYWLGTYLGTLSLLSP